MGLELLFSIEEAAKRLGGVSKWTIRAWISQRRLKPTKIGSRTMLSESELEKFVLTSNKSTNAGVSSMNPSNTGKK